MGKKKKPAEISQAQAADRYALYQVAVQQPSADVSFATRTFRSRYGRSPELLREDFCGTAHVACAWAASGAGRFSFGVDLDPEPLAWGRAHNVAALTEVEQERVRLVQGDVREVAGPPADVLMVGNFSFNVFKRRHDLLAYFRAARSHMVEQSIMILDVLGGPETQQGRHETSRKELGFEYLWEQRSFDPLTHEAAFAIHFRFDDGSSLWNAFTYEWRIWSLPEIRDALLESGFSAVDVFWERPESRGPDKVLTFQRVTKAPPESIWIAEVVGIR